MRTWCVISIITKNKPHAHNKAHFHTMKVYNTHDQSFANFKDSSFFLSPTEVFACSKVINAYLWTDPFWKSSTFNLS